MEIALVTATHDAGPSDIAAFAAYVDRPLIAALQARGASVYHPAWSDPDVDWGGYDLAVIRTTWDYTDRRDDFIAWANRAAASTVVLNPPDVLRWNSHKSYLLELEDRGAPVVPSAWLGQGDRIDLGALLASRGWTRAVLKPAVGAGGRGMLRVAASVTPAAAGGERAGGPADPTGTPATRAGGGERGADEADLAAGQAHLDALLAEGDAVVQPFLASVTRRGELSVVLIDGEVSHVVRKRPPEGEFRIHEHRGGRYAIEPDDAEAAALARWVVESTGVDLLFARVDLLEDDTGVLQLAELEVTEPDLYLNLDEAPDAADRLAAGIVRRVTG